MGLPLIQDLKYLNFDFLLSLGPGYWADPSKRALGKFFFSFYVYYDMFTSHKTFPGGSVLKNLPANAGDTGLIPDPGRSHTPRSNKARAPQLTEPVL